MGPAVAFLGRESIVITTGAVYLLGLLVLTPHFLVGDSWLTLVAGREIVERGLPTEDFTSRLAFGETWIDQQWLAQAGYYLLALVGGTKLALLVHLGVLVSALGLAAAAARRAGARPTAVAAIAAICVFAAPWSWQLRAQALAYPLFAGVLLALAPRTMSVVRAVVVVGLLVLWANVHGSVLLGVAVVVGFSLSEIVRRARNGFQGRAIALPTALGCGALLAVVATPYGVGIIDYYRRMFFEAPLAEYVVEWQRSYPSVTTIPFYVLVTVVFVLAVRRRRALAAFDVFVLALTVVGGVLALRGIVWFAIAALALVPRLFAAKEPSEGRVNLRANAAIAAVAVLAGAAAVGVVAAKPATWFERKWSVAAASAAAEAARAGDTAVLADPANADWLLWREPELRGRLAFDLRFELLSAAELRALSDFSNALGRDWERFADPYGVVVLNADNDLRGWRRLVGGPAWERVFDDGKAAVYRRVVQPR